MARYRLAFIKKKEDFRRFFLPSPQTRQWSGCGKGRVATTGWGGCGLLGATPPNRVSVSHTHTTHSLSLFLCRIVLSRISSFGIAAAISEEVIASLHRLAIHITGIMLWYYTPALLMLLNSVFGFPRGKVTEKPEIPPMVNPVPPKNRKTPTHISEFTDPDTGLNPFLDLEEGPTSVGRNVMEDERRDDAPYFDIDLVEGDAPNRRWGLEEPKEHLGRVPVIWPSTFNKDDNDMLSTSTVLPNPTTTVEMRVTKTIELVPDDSDETIQHKIIKGEKEAFVVSQSTVIYATATIAAVVTIVILIGACWWRRKLKTPQSSATVENSEVKS